MIIDEKWWIMNYRMVYLLCDELLELLILLETLLDGLQQCGLRLSHCHRSLLIPSLILSRGWRASHFLVFTRRSRITCSSSVGIGRSDGRLRRNGRCRSDGGRCRRCTRRRRQNGRQRTRYSDLGLQWRWSCSYVGLDHLVAHCLRGSCFKGKIKINKNEINSYIYLIIFYNINDFLKIHWIHFYCSFIHLFWLFL